MKRSAVPNRDNMAPHIVHFSPPTCISVKIEHEYWVTSHGWLDDLAGSSVFQLGRWKSDYERISALKRSSGLDKISSPGSGTGMGEGLKILTP